MRLGSFLLFTLIASVVLAVSSIPVKGWSRPGQGRGQFKLTGGVTKKKPRVRAKKVTVQTIATVTLLDGKTGEISTTGVPLHSQLQVWLEKQIFEEIFGLSSRSYRNYRNKIEWKGLYDPSPSELLSRQWLYFNITEITGIEDQTNKKCPCFGWTAKGPKNVLKPGGSAVVNNKGFKQRYIGISPGKQAPNYFEGKWGKPVSKTADLVIDALGKVWETLLAEFKAYFIAPRVTFISGIDGEPLPGPDYTGSGLNAAINGALHRGPNDRIIYHGPYLPFPGNQPSVLFKLAAVGQCTETSPCLGWIAQGGDPASTNVHGHRKRTLREKPSFHNNWNVSSDFQRTSRTVELSAAAAATRSTGGGMAEVHEEFRSAAVARSAGRGAGMAEIHGEF
ncbi:hypothetical protein BDP27DRAFT_1430665 [Rhodocollybia butyracea]|uniref:Uncharacterized protein n=1 Tax=Rhodocollybia butyracea TaxID=206335 RepID=A0A9P5P816_9AGAR|nr:hypothetical protein BDP27DRAFT_1430665 [Rhodocollybia butyracea]